MKDGTDGSTVNHPHRMSIVEMRWKARHGVADEGGCLLNALLRRGLLHARNRLPPCRLRRMPGVRHARSRRLPMGVVGNTEGLLPANKLVVAYQGRAIHPLPRLYWPSSSITTASDAEEARLVPPCADVLAVAVDTDSLLAVPRGADSTDALSCLKN